MFRDKTEVKILIVRQNLKDALDALLLSKTPIDMKSYKSLKVKYLLVDELLQEHRLRLLGPIKTKGIR
jgi:hypothetical protein